MQDNKKIEFTNTLRGLAALSVLISHYFGVFWFARDAIASFINGPVLSVAELPTPAFIPLLWPVANFSWGLYGVAVFFLISGFVIPFSLAKMSFTSFCVSRFVRIVPTYVVGFTITMLAIYVSTSYFASPWTYSKRDILIHYIPGLRDLLGTRSFDGIIWTLEIEVKFYVVCALATVLFRRQSLTVFAIPAALFASALLIGMLLTQGYFVSETSLRLVSTYLLNAQFIVFMFLGVTFHYLHQQIIAERTAFLLVGVLLFLFSIQWSSGPHSGAFSQMWNYGLALLTFMLAFTFPRLFKSNRVFNFLADVSYPLYVVHGVAGFAAMRILLDKGVSPLAALMLVSAGCLFVAWLLHKLVEAPSQAWIRTWNRPAPNPAGQAYCGG